MAKMIPSTGPQQNDSRTAEPLIYQALSQQLSDEFVVIHSLPWLGAAAKEITGKHAVTGEIDFLVLHPVLGVLAIEVKGGRLRYEQSQFVFPNGERINPIAQVRKGVHTLARWLVGAGGPGWRIGYAIAFPESSMQNRLIPPALIDMTQEKPESICIDRLSMGNIASRITQIMTYWKRALNNSDLTIEKVRHIIKLICPIEDYSLQWRERIEENNRRWLLLTSEQSKHLARLDQHQRIVITGRSGTGKTLLAMSHARHLASQGKRVLFLVYNAQLAVLIKTEIEGTSISVSTFHQLCRHAITQLGWQVPDPLPENWYQVDAPQALTIAVKMKRLPLFDALIIDETQVFHESWLQTIETWFTEKPISAFCDETQVFSYEHCTSATSIAQIMEAPSPFMLTVNMRSPRKIFQRMDLFAPTPYEQHSPRPYEEDELVEIATPNPDRQLHETIMQLHKDGIAAKDILVVYFNTKDRPVYRNGIEQMVGKTISVYKCRGIEAPIVIVWAIEPQFALLACAYSRATTRCIAIYNAIPFVWYQERSPYCDIIAKVPEIQASLPMMRPIALKADVVLSQKMRIYWSPTLWGWIFYCSVYGGIEEGLWFSLLCEITNASIYVVHDTWIRRYTHDNRQEGKIFAIYWCRKCDRWTSHLSHQGDIGECMECAPFGLEVVPVEEASILQGIEQHIIANKPLPSTRIEPLMVMLLRQWYALSKDQQSLLNSYSHMSISEKRDLSQLCCVITGLAILSLNEGETITTSNILEKYLFKTGVLEKESAELPRWKGSVAAHLGVWGNRKCIEKVGKGVFRRLPIEMPLPSQSQKSSGVIRLFDSKEE